MSVDGLYKKWIRRYDIEEVNFTDSVKKLSDAIILSGYQKKDFVKTWIFLHKDTHEIAVCLIKAGSNVDKRRIDNVSSPKRWVFASKADLTRIIGFEEGTVPPFFLREKLKIIIDSRILVNESIITWGKNEFQLLKLNHKFITSIAAEIRPISFG